MDHPIAMLDAPQAHDDGLLAPARRALTVGLVLVVTIAGFEALAVATAMPHAQDDLGGVRLYGWTFASFMLANLVGITVAGEQGDRHGPARPFVAALVLFGAGLLIGGLAPSMAVLVVARGIQGFGGGALLSVVYIVIARGYDERLRARMFAIMSSAWILPALLGPALAGVVAEYLSWRLVFLGLLPLVAAGLVLTLPGMRQLGAPEQRAPVPTRAWRALQLAVGAGLVLGGITTPTPYAAAPLVLGGIVLALPALNRLMPPGTLTARHGIAAAIAVQGLVSLAFFGTDAFVPYAVTTLRGNSAIVGGLALTSGALGWTAGSWMIERLTGRISRERTALAGAAIVVVNVLLVSFVTIEAVPSASAALPWAFAGLGMGLAYPSLSLIVLRGAEPGQEGAASSALKLSEVLGSAVGTGVAGAVVALGESGGWHAGGVALAFGLMAAGALLATVSAARIGTRDGAAA